jgi:hypothetical protein
LLIIAVKRGYAKLVIILLIKGAKTDLVNLKGFIALKIALVNKQVAIVEELIKASAKK